MSREPGRGDQIRERTAYQAARLLAEDGITDFGAAKRKAARQLGCTESRNLPTNQEIEDALRRYQALYHAEAHRDRLKVLLCLARDCMHAFARFRPQLAGGLVTGNVGKNSGIQVLLYADSSKDVEMYLMNERLRFAQRETKLFVGGALCRLPAFAIEADEADVEFSVLAIEHEKLSPRAADGRSLPRATLGAVEALIASYSDSPATG